MRVSIITVSYNSASTIRDTIESVLAQEYSDIEYILIDGNSKDSTLEIIHSYGSRIAHVLSEKDKGIYDAMNKGIALATGDIVGILNSDDFYTDSTVIGEVVNHFQKANTESVYGDLDYVKTTPPFEVVRKWRSGAYNPNRFYKGWMPPHPSFFILRNCYEQHGTFNLQFKRAADYELMLRMLLKHNISSSHLPKVLVKMRIGGASNSSLKARIEANKEDRKAWDVNGLKPKWLTLIRKPFSKILQYL
jgi:glycosyltransferase involved in cell wall biosynthesis